jgi:hypothetical protein
MSRQLVSREKITHLGNEIKLVVSTSFGQNTQYIFILVDCSL